MAAAGSGASTSVPGTGIKQKKSRPNPSRRKASNAKKGVKAETEKAVGVNSRESAQSTHESQLSKSTQAQGAAGKPLRQKNAQGKTSSARSTSCTEPEHNPSKLLADKKSKPSTSPTLATPAIATGGLIGCAAGAAVLLGAGLWKDIGGVDSAILAVRTAKLSMNNLCEEIITSLRAGTYNTPEALDMLRRTTLAYASAIPGGAPVVERIFREVDMVRKQRGREVDQVVMKTYDELSKARQRSAGSIEMQAIILRNLAQLSTVAANASQDVLARNPKLKPVAEGATKALKRPPEPKVPTVKLNMSIKHRPVVAA